MEPAKIVLRALAIFCGYGLLFGLVSSWVCPEAYVDRAKEFGERSVPVLGMLWGMYDFLIYSAAVGIGTALAAFVGHRPTVKAFFFTKPMLMLAAIVAVIGAVAGVFGRYMVIAGKYQYWLPPDRHAAYLSTWWGLLASQGALIIGGVTLAVWTWRKRIVFEQMVQAGEIGAGKRSTPHT